ncbi:MAG: large-conductance mechanosensitive channel protein MscL [Prevotella micans]|nr:large-conductance mechanosensitive channel protein MscL [Prevotella micans]
MNSFLKEFKEFAMRGNVMDMAVGVIIGAAFGKIVSSLVDDIIMPLLGVITGGIDFSGLIFNVEDATVKYGMFLQNILDFIIIAFCIFLMMKGMNTLAKRWKEEPKPEEPAKPNNEEVLLTEIRDLLKEK